MLFPNPHACSCSPALVHSQTRTNPSYQHTLSEKPSPSLCPWPWAALRLSIILQPIIFFSTPEFVVARSTWLILPILLILGHYSSLLVASRTSLSSGRRAGPRSCGEKASSRWPKLRKKTYTIYSILAFGTRVLESGRYLPCIDGGHSSRNVQALHPLEVWSC